MATIMAAAPTPLSRRAVRASVREDTEQVRAEASQVPVLSYAQALTGRPHGTQQVTLPSGLPPMPAPRTKRRRPPGTTVQTGTVPPAQQSPDPRDQIIASLQLTLKAIGELLPPDSPLRALCLQAGGMPPVPPQHGQ